VAPAATSGKYEILTGQRRFLAHQEIGAEEIMALVLDERVDETTAKVISVTENLVRLDLNRRDLIDACTALYKRYGSMKDVAEATGLPYHKVRDYVKYDRLIPELKELVDEGLDLKAALRAQDAASVDAEPKPQEAVTLAKEMAGMSGVQQEKLKQERQQAPDRPVDDVIEEAKSGSKITQVVVTLSDTVHRSLQQYADVEGTNQDDAAAGLIEEALTGKGFLG
jgi:ParB family chromosome partitioning protein